MGHTMDRMKKEYAFTKASARFLSLAITVALACGGCAHNSPPAPMYYSVGTFDALDAIGYQTLRRGDFKATAPPSEGKGIPVAASAALVAVVTVAPGSGFSVVPLKTEGDSTRFEATAHNLHFRATMDRNKSWWRSELDSISTAEVLEHEQIHFAIFELAARDLNVRIPEIATRIRSTGRTSGRSAPYGERTFGSGARSVESEDRRTSERVRPGHVERHEPNASEGMAGPHPGGACGPAESVNADSPMMAS